MTIDINKILKDFKGTGIKRASDAFKFTTYPTPFATVTNLIGGIPKGRFTTVAGYSTACLFRDK